MLNFIKSWALVISMVLGIALNSYLIPLSVTIPYLLSIMLFLSFSKIDFRRVRVTNMHLSMFAIQMITSVIIYLLLLPFSVTVAQGTMLCIMIPTATSASVVVGIMGGNIASIATYTLLSSVACAVLTPILFSLIGISDSMNFASSLQVVAKSILPIFLMPLVLSWVIDRFLPKLKSGMAMFFPLSFYIWAIALMIVTGQTVDSIMIRDPDEGGVILELSLAGASLLVCISQFYIGKRLGKRYDMSLEASQSMGQKNTIYGIWLAQMYLVPHAALAPACYVLWQNISNSFKIWQHRRAQHRHNN